MKIIRMCLYITIILLLVLSIYIYKLKPQNEEYVDFNKASEENLPVDRIYPNNFSEFYFMYDGMIISNDIYNMLYNINVIGIPTFYNDIKKIENNEIQYCYEVNENINKFIDYEHIDKLVKIFDNIELKKLNYKKCEIIKNSCVKYSNKTEFVLNVTYEYDIHIKFKVIVYNNLNSNLEFIPLIEE